MGASQGDRVDWLIVKKCDGLECGQEDNGLGKAGGVYGPIEDKELITLGVEMKKVHFSP